jgi:hypothetical protein
MGAGKRGAPRKYGDRAVFTYRAEIGLWEDFLFLLMIKKDTATAFFTRAIGKYVNENRKFIDAMRKAMAEVMDNSEQAVETAKAPKE